jgi:hypothetical protein
VPTPGTGAPTASETSGRSLSEILMSNGPFPTRTPRTHRGRSQCQRAQPTTRRFATHPTQACENWPHPLLQNWLGGAILPKSCRGLVAQDVEWRRRTRKKARVPNRPGRVCQIMVVASPTRGMSNARENLGTNPDTLVPDCHHHPEAPFTNEASWHMLISAHGPPGTYMQSGQFLA